MKNVFVALVLFLGTGIAVANEVSQESQEVFDQYVQVNESVRNSGWDYLGCAASKASCDAKAQAHGYSESKLVYLTCTPRSTDFSCFAK